MNRVFNESSRLPDEAFLLCETQEDAEEIDDAIWDLCIDDRTITVHVLETPMDGQNYAVIPYSNKINWALDRVTSDAVLYLDNGSMPHVDKIRVMADALDTPGVGAVYCGQRRTGYQEVEHHAGGEPLASPGHQVNYTQVMHRPTGDRWTLNMDYANPDVADSMFWNQLAKTLGPFHPCGEGLILDEHHIPSPAATGV